MITEFTYPSELSEEDVTITVTEYVKYYAGNRDEQEIHESIAFVVTSSTGVLGFEEDVPKSEYEEILEVFKALNSIN